MSFVIVWIDSEHARLFELHADGRADKHHVDRLEPLRFCQIGTKDGGENNDRQCHRDPDSLPDEEENEKLQDRNREEKDE